MSRGDSSGGHCKICDSQARDRAFLCDGCLRDLTKDVGDMQSLLHEVSMLATGQTRVYRANGRGGEPAASWDHEERQIPAMLRSKEGRATLPETRMVANLPARELLFDAYDTLLSAACDLGADEISSTKVIGWLLTNITLARTSEEGPRLFDEIAYLHRQLERSVDRIPSRLYAGPCRAVAEVSGERCDRKLFAYPGADEILCDGFDPEHASTDVGCRALHTALDRQEFLIAEVDDALLSLLTWQTALPKLLPDLAWPRRTTWWRWTTSQRLVVKTIDRNGTELYRGGDIIDLVVSDQARLSASQSRRPRMSA